MSVNKYYKALSSWTKPRDIKSINATKAAKGPPLNKYYRVKCQYKNIQHKLARMSNVSINCNFFYINILEPLCA